MERLNVSVPAATTPKTCRCGALIAPVRIDGYADYFPPYCPSCFAEDALKEQEKLQACSLEEMGLRGYYKGVTFDNLHDPRPSAKIIEACRLYAASALANGGGGLYLWSKCNGNGKTHLAAAILTSVGRGLFVNIADLLESLRDAYQREEVCYLIPRCQSTPLLVLDDLDAGLTERNREWVSDRLYLILNRRWDERRPTIVTSNLAPFLVKQEFGPKLASRILGGTQIIEVDGPDHRLRGARTLC